MKNSFEEIYNYIKSLPSKSTPALMTTGRVGKVGDPFIAYARDNHRGAHIVSLSGKQSRTYIYEDKKDWGNPLNSSGTRIAHYAKPIDEWYSQQREKVKSNKE